MSNKHKAEQSTESTVVEQPVAAAVEAPAANFTLTYRRRHPGGGVLGRCSYGIAGVSGIVVFDVGMFANAEPPTTITVDVPLAQPKADAKAAREAAQAAKVIERAAKAQARLDAQTAKAAERQAKADAALAAAKAKLEAAQAAKAATTPTVQ